jgi:hypothetical protein
MRLLLLRMRGRTVIRIARKGHASAAFTYACGLTGSTAQTTL